ncbi:MAG: MBL fold metallo-hydrolase [Saprospiraceae bacterium]|nr:MBL fold metallo-hydrolase [Saprospiraceae bacterium]
MIVTFWGTRGSIATVGSQTQVYGGNTPCVSVASGESLVILDAGSGIRRLAEKGYYKRFNRIHILLTHLHMDHIQGLGFFDMFFDPAAEIHIWGPPSTSASLKMRLHRYLSPPLFPVRIRDFSCQLHLHEVTQETFFIEPFYITTNFVLHPGPTLAFRLTDGDKVVSYIPDHEPALGAKKFPISPDWTSGYTLAQSADLLIHDAQYSEEEYSTRQGWGHSSMHQALQFAQLAQVKRLELFHHDPSHSDAQLDAMYQEYVNGQWDFEVHLAVEDQTISL